MTISPTGSAFGSVFFGRSWPAAWRSQLAAGGASSAFVGQPSLRRSLYDLYGALSAEPISLHVQRHLLGRVETGLSNLRNILQATREQVSANLGRSDLRAIIKDLEQTVEQSTYTTQDVYETRPVYEQREIRATNVYGTRDLSGYSSISSAGISNGSDFSIQVGGGSVAIIEFKNSTKITLTVDGATRTFSFSSSGGAWRTGLLNALNGIADLSAELTPDGRLHLQTADAQSLTIADVNGGLLDLSGSPLASLGLSAGTTESSVVGYEEVEVGSEQVKVGSERIGTGTRQVSLGTVALVVGFDRVQESGANSELHASLRDLIGAVSALTSAAGASSIATAVPGTDSVRALAADLAALLTSTDFTALANTADPGALDSMIEWIEGALSRAGALGKEIVANSAHLAAAAQSNLAAMLIDSGLQVSTTADPVGLARQTGDSLRGMSFGLIRNYRLSFWS
jgi:hypothetical protein